jgi:hypothetical protein
MMITKKALHRRTFLRGVGAALALPFLDAMSPALAGPIDGAASPAVRLGFFYVPNGIINLKGEWTPTGEGKDFEFSSTMRALAPHREHLNIFTGLAQANGRSLGDGAGDHARAGATWLTGVHPVKTQGFGLRSGVSADQLAGMELGKYTQFGSLELGVEEPSMAGNCDSGYSCAYSNTLSWRNETTAVPIEDNPRRVFERLFGDGGSTDPKIRLARMQEQRSILDFVREETARLTPGLGARDKNKLDQYMDAVRDVERRIQRAEEQKAMNQLPLMDRPVGIPDLYEDHVKLMMDLQILAFQADLTRVITFMMGREGSNITYPGIGVPDAHHPTTHHQNDPEKVAKVIKIDEHHVELFSYMVGRMKETPDGDGSLLDHSMLLYGSSISDGNQHLHDNLPLVLAGGGGGRLTGGRHIRYETETPMTNLLVSMLDKAGVPVDNLGDSTGELNLLSGV